MVCPPFEGRRVLFLVSSQAYMSFGRSFVSILVPCFMAISQLLLSSQFRSSLFFLKAPRLCSIGAPPSELCVMGAARAWKFDAGATRRVCADNTQATGGAGLLARIFQRCYQIMS